MRADNAGPATLDRVRRHLVGLRMPRTLEVLDHTMQQLERGEIGAVEAIDMLLCEEFTGREGPRVKAALILHGFRGSPALCVVPFRPWEAAGV